MVSCSAAIDLSLARAAGSTKLEGSREADVSTRAREVQVGACVRRKGPRTGVGECPSWQPDLVLTLPESSRR